AVCALFFFYCSRSHRALHSFPTRRSSDLHPLVRQTIEDCLTEAMDIEGLKELLQRIESRMIECIACDLPEPSPLAHEILNAKPRSEEHTSELQSRSDLVCRLLLEKKKKKN